MFRSFVSQLLKLARAFRYCREPTQADPLDCQTSLDELQLYGYADPLVGHPGDEIGFYVSSAGKHFRSEIVRCRHLDSNPNGPGLKVTPVGADCDGEYKQDRQALNLGSFVRLPNHPSVDFSRTSFTITAWIAPTTIPGSNLNPLAMRRSPAGTPRTQAIFSRWSKAEDRGLALVIDSEGHLACWVADAEGRAASVSLDEPLIPSTPSIRSVEIKRADAVRPMMTGVDRWYFVAVSFDRTSKSIELTQIPAADNLEGRSSFGVKSLMAQGPALVSSDAMIGALATDNGAGEASCHFNGKIDEVQIFDRALKREELSDVMCNISTFTPKAHWDFGASVELDEIVDVAGSCSGVAINRPLRAVAGHLWSGNEIDFKRAPREFSAICFHEDDVGDSNWTRTFSFKIPAGVKSGIYAARLWNDAHEFYMTFFVSPRSDNSNRSRVAMLLPTFTYLAYGQSGAEFDYSGNLYSRHSDGSGVFYSGHRRPLLDLQPDASGPNGVPWGLEADSHIVDWLESIGQEVDYITDHDLHLDGPVRLSEYRVIITGSHPEYVSREIWESLWLWLRNGGRMMYMGGNGFYWVTSLSANCAFLEVRRHSGTEHWQAPLHECHHSTTGEFGGLWRFRGRPPQKLVGVGFTAQGFSSKVGGGNYGRPYLVLPDARSFAGRWVFEGVTSSRIGKFPSLQNQGGPAGEEIDRADFALGTPTTTLLLATAKGFGDEYVHAIEEVNTANLMQGGATNPNVRADMTLMYYPNEGAVWSVGSIAWSGSLFYNHHSNDVARVSLNVLRGFQTLEKLPKNSSLISDKNHR